MCLSSTLFPDPERPMIAVIRCRGMSRVTPSSAFFPSKVFSTAFEAEDRFPGPPAQPAMSSAGVMIICRTDVRK